jgi:formiminotetrahydrofolate cyclodeaminase
VHTRAATEKDERHTHMQARLKATTKAPENHARSAKEKKWR